MDSRASVTERVVDAVAAAEDRDPIDLPPLQNIIETDALNALFDANQGVAAPIEVCFCFSESIVTVHGDGTIEVAPRRPDTEAAIFHTGVE